MNENSKIGISMLAGLIAGVLLVLSYRAGEGNGHRTALESGFWFCVPNKSRVEVSAPKKTYEPQR